MKQGNKLVLEVLTYDVLTGNSAPGLPVSRLIIVLEHPRLKFQIFRCLRLTESCRPLTQQVLQSRQKGNLSALKRSEKKFFLTHPTGQPCLTAKKIASCRTYTINPGLEDPILVISSKKAPVLKGIEEKSRLGIKELSRKKWIDFICRRGLVVRSRLGYRKCSICRNKMNVVLSQDRLEDIQNRTPSLTPVPVTRPITKRFDGQDTGILLKKKKKNKINKKKVIFTLCLQHRHFHFYTVSS
ncbi:hypothetical protein AVEN_164508-1 [Araneus ventricosus]|uniref:Uncharacterized protein n=1 Tax=Araneus ventricosus TaxID=182803 RepID=A0A4Y2SM12_ARAVE|nr:hypothetical protein AVEN_164508-1 [Araneus ventricosus]